MSYKDGRLLSEIVVHRQNLVLSFIINTLKHNRASEVIDIQRKTASFDLFWKLALSTEYSAKSFFKRRSLSVTVDKS